MILALSRDIDFIKWLESLVLALLDVFNVLQSCLLTPFKQTNFKMIKAYVTGQMQTL